MSIEALLLLGAFLLLPLLERLLRSAQARTGDDGGPANQPRRAPVPLPLPLPQPSSSPDGTAATYVGLQRVGAEPLPDMRPRVAPVVTSRRRPTGIALDLRRPAALRRAMVLATLLGPCRALEPHAEG